MAQQEIQYYRNIFCRIEFNVYLFLGLMFIILVKHTIGDKSDYTTICILAEVHVYPIYLFYIPALLLFLIASGLSMYALLRLWNLRYINPPQFHKVIHSIISATNARVLSINTPLFINGYIRTVQQEQGLQNLHVPYDVKQLCTQFYARDTDRKEFNQHTVIIPFSLDSVSFAQHSIHNVLERNAVIVKHTQPAIVMMNASGCGFIIASVVCLTLSNISTMDRCLWPALIGVINGVAFLYFYRLSSPNYYWQDYWSKAFHFDVIHRTIEEIHCCGHYGEYPNDIHEPVIYTRNTRTLCTFSQLRASSLTNTGFSTRVDD
eukprot:78068_1